MFKDFSVFPNVSFENKHYEEYYQRSHRVGYRRKKKYYKFTAKTRDRTNEITRTKDQNILFQRRVWELKFTLNKLALL